MSKNETDYIRNSPMAGLNGDTLLFAVFCIEGISEYLEMGGAEVYKLLTGNSDILDSYIIKYYDALHTQGKGYIIEELVGLMKKEGLL